MDTNQQTAALETAYALNSWDKGLRERLEAALAAEGLDQEAVDERVAGIAYGSVEPRRPEISDLADESALELVEQSAGGVEL